MTGAQQLIDALWDFDDPLASEQRFSTAAADPNHDRTVRLELRTQLARALGLQRKFSQAHAELDGVIHESKQAGSGEFGAASTGAAAAARTPSRSGDGTTMEAAGGAAGGAAGSAAGGAAVVLIRVELERGRVLNAQGRPDAAMDHFRRAHAMALACGEDHLSVDAAHMIAIAHGRLNRSDAALEWNRIALELAAGSTCARARQWRASLHNNIGWSLHDQQRFSEALEHFHQALDCRRELGNERDVRIAQWCIARCLRSLGRIEDALRLQQQLHQQHMRDQREDPYVSEEMGECLLALGRPAEAQVHFAAAHAALARDEWFAQQHPQRLERMRQLARG